MNHKFLFLIFLSFLNIGCSDFWHNQDGNKKFDLGKYEDAIINYSKAIEIDPTDATYYLNRAQAKIELRDIKGAREDVILAYGFLYNRDTNHLRRTERLIKVREEISLEKSNIAYKYFSERNYDSCLFYCNYSLEWDKTNSNAYYIRAAIKEISQDYTGAIQDLSLLIEIDSTSGRYFKTRGDLYAKTGQIDKACLDFDKAINLSNAEALNSKKIHCQ